MVTKIEKQFFEAFDIKPIQLNYCSYRNLYDYGIEIGDDICLAVDDEELTCEKCRKNKKGELIYPTITDKIYLELITELSGVCGFNFAFERSINELKVKILSLCISHEKLLKPQIHEIFNNIQ